MYFSRQLSHAGVKWWAMCVLMARALGANMCLVRGGSRQAGDCVNPCEMPRLTIIIPFYQKEVGILSRAVRSAYEQRGIDDLTVTVIVVDDASPIDPQAEIDALGSPPPRWTVRVVRRANGGPAAARNTGLDAIEPGTDFIALLDSDDVWRSDHLARGMAGLADGRDLYFSDHGHSEDSASYLSAAGLYAAMCAGTAPFRAVADAPRMVECDAHPLAEAAALEYVAHTSSIIYSTARCSHVRMMESLRYAGEDHVFFLDLVLNAGSVCISLEPEVELGAGVDMYKGAFEWGTTRDFRRRVCNLAALKMIRSRTDWRPAVRAEVDRYLARERQIVGYLLMRRVLAQGRLDMTGARLMWENDPLTVLCAPLNLISAFDKGRIAAARAGR